MRRLFKGAPDLIKSGRCCLTVLFRQLNISRIEDRTAAAI